MDKKFLSAEEISEYFGIPLNTIYRLSRTGKIKGIKIGKQWRYAKADIEEILATGVSPRKLPARKPEEFREKREYPRINCNIKCSYRIEIPAIKQFRSETGCIRNISGGGIFLTDKAENLANITAGDPVELDFGLGQFQGIKTDGRVIRRDENGIIIYGVGIKFRNINNECQNKIIEYVG